jgi:glutamyl-tRNA reductase
MNFYLIGIDHKKTPLELREAAYLRRAEIREHWLSASPARSAVLITCNRIEIYGVADSIGEAKALRSDFISHFSGLFSNSYTYYGRRRVTQHMLRLALGLESMLAGEYGIMEQIARWIEEDSVPDELRSEWERVLEMAGWIRKETGLDREDVSIARALYEDLLERIGAKEEARILVIGTGKVASLMAERRPAWARLEFVARKKRDKALGLAALSGGSALLPEDIPGHLARADAVVSATSSPHHALDASHFSGTICAGSRTLYIYDLAFPRDVACEVGNMGSNVLIGPGELADGFSRNHAWLKERIDAADLLAKEALRHQGRSYEDTRRVATERSCAVAS